VTVWLLEGMPRHKANGIDFRQACDKIDKLFAVLDLTFIG